jgi:hypothetical protein
MARADAAGCRVYGERILRAMNIYARNTGKKGQGELRADEQVWTEREEFE